MRDTVLHFPTRIYKDRTEASCSLPTRSVMISLERAALKKDASLRSTHLKKVDALSESGLDCITLQAFLGGQRVESARGRCRYIQIVRG